LLPPSSGRDSERPLVVVVRGLEVVVDGEANALHELDRLEVPGAIGTPVYLGLLGNRPCYGAPLASEDAMPPGLGLESVRRLFPELDPDRLAAVGQALALVEWDITSRYCGRCAEPTRLVEGERARRCSRCDAVFHPRVSPAVIVSVERDGKILLARNARFPTGRFSILAGFVEPGESLEDALRREVREEVGIEVTEIRYYGSQPWPFGRSLMIGFTACHAGGSLRVDGREILEAAWFAPGELPELPPKISIARQIIDAFVTRALDSAGC
jgi:NAD+ diphosphatase